jgi:xylan 1,4-beta-xylosidase
VARRQQALLSAATVIDFEPEHWQQMAGLVCYYNGLKFHYLYISANEDGGKFLQVMSACRPAERRCVYKSDPTARGEPVQLRVEVDYERLALWLSS